MYCEYCGKVVDDDSMFCLHCGAKLDYSASESRNDDSNDANLESRAESKKEILPYDDAITEIKNEAKEAIKELKTGIGTIKSEAKNMIGEENLINIKNTSKKFIDKIKKSL